MGGYRPPLRIASSIGVMLLAGVVAPAADRGRCEARVHSGANVQDEWIDSHLSQPGKSCIASCTLAGLPGANVAPMPPPV